MQTLTTRTLATGVGFSEGPVIRPSGEILFVSMSQGRLCRVATKADGTTEAETFAESGGSPNGATEGIDGTVYLAQSGGKWSGGSPRSNVTGGVQAVALDGSVRFLTKDPISPNDLCFGPDGYLYVTDPTRQPVSKPTRTDGRLFRCDVSSGETELLCSLPWYPNGIGVGIDDALYVAHCVGERPMILRYSLDGGRLGKGEPFALLPFGLPDGFLFDADGNLLVGAVSEVDQPGQLQLFDRNGKLIETFYVGPERKYTNVALGPERMLVITDSNGGKVLAVDNWPIAGLPLYPFRARPGRSPS